MDKEMEDEITPRSNSEVAQRVLGLIASIGKVHFTEPNEKWILENGIRPYLTALEASFVGSESPTEKERVNYSWKAEALVSLLWSLNGLEQMPRLNEQFDIFKNEMVVQAIRETAKFLRDASLRPYDELQEQESFLYHQHWRVRDRDHGFNNGKQIEDNIDISDLDTSVVYERRYGMSWVVGNGDTWDEVPTDT